MTNAPTLARPMILVHGLGGGPGDFSDTVRFLTSNTENTANRAVLTGREGEVADPGADVYVVNLDGNQSPEENAARLRRIVQQVNIANCGRDGVDVVGHSRGGDDLRNAMRDMNAYDRNSIRHVITLGTPHRGSELAPLYGPWNAALGAWNRSFNPIDAAAAAVGALGQPNHANELAIGSRNIQNLRREEGDFVRNTRVMTVAGILGVPTRNGTAGLAWDTAVTENSALLPGSTQLRAYGSPHMELAQNVDVMREVVNFTLDRPVAPLVVYTPGPLHPARDAVAQQAFNGLNYLRNNAPRLQPAADAIAQQTHNGLNFLRNTMRSAENEARSRVGFNVTA